MEFGKKRKGISSEGSERLYKKAEIPPHGTVRICSDPFYQQRSFSNGVACARRRHHLKFFASRGFSPRVLFACFFDIPLSSAREAVMSLKPGA